MGICFPLMFWLDHYLEKMNTPCDVVSVVIRKARKKVEKRRGRKMIKKKFESVKNCCSKWPPNTVNPKISGDSLY